jgi:hypothetical protein
VNGNSKCDSDRLQCPSAQPGMESPSIFGVIGGQAGAECTSYFDARIPATDEALSITGDVAPLKVYRIAAQCEQSKCLHFDGSDCQLARRIVQLLPLAVDELPNCAIRPECRWFAQEGAPACRRCPQIVTLSDTTNPILLEAAGMPRVGTSPGQGSLERPVAHHFHGDFPLAAISEG